MFKCPSTNQPVVLKIIPIEARTPVNGEAQKKFDEILQEIIISVELSALRNGQDNTTDGFVNVKRVTCVKGAYPAHLIDEWELFRDNRPEGSENDHPEIFDDEQLYIVFELCNGGRDLEAFVFNNALEAQSIFYQVSTIPVICLRQLSVSIRSCFDQPVERAEKSRSTAKRYVLCSCFRFFLCFIPSSSSSFSRLVFDLLCYTIYFF